MKDQKASIDWDQYKTDFIRLETGAARKLKLTNWQQGTWFNRPCLRLDVLEENHKPVRKTLNTTSKRLIRALKPIIQKAEQKGRSDISVSILKIGEGLDTLYEVRENE